MRPLLLSALLLFACAPDPVAPACIAGRVAPCPCPGGLEGSQVCESSGAFGACACPGDAGVDARDGREAPPADAELPRDTGASAVDGGPDACTQGTATDCCGVRCSTSHGGAACVMGRCTIACDPGFGDCDGDVANGCEVELRWDFNHCGRCGRACPGTQVCREGECVGGGACGLGVDGGPPRCDVHAQCDGCHVRGEPRTTRYCCVFGTCTRGSEPCL